VASGAPEGEVGGGESSAMFATFGAGEEEEAALSEVTVEGEAATVCAPPWGVAPEPNG
jgi:hypothetical protein